jgi:hypothetical protein
MISSGKLRAPFMELSFYLGPGDHRLEVSLLLGELRSQGAEVDSEILAKNRQGKLIARRCSVEEIAELSGLDDGFACELRKFPGFAPKGDILECEGARILLRTEAGPLSKPKPTRASREAAGLKAYQAFKCMADSIDAAYGAICIEYSLETPAELREDSRSLAFRNFWLSRRRIAEGLLHRASQRMSGAFIEEWAGGVYFSTDAAYNPARVGLEPEDSEERSVAVAQILARALIA